MGNLPARPGVCHLQVDLLPPVAKSASPLPSLKVGFAPKLPTFSLVALPPEHIAQTAPGYRLHFCVPCGRHYWGGDDLGDILVLGLSIQTIWVL